jgi:hypothetical protein
VLLLPQ